MLRSMWIAAAIVSLAVGCAADRGGQEVRHAAMPTETADPARDTYALGTQLTREGAIPREATGDAFRRGGEVFLSVDVTGASTDQKIEVEWIDPAGEVMRRDAKEMPQGSQYAPFSSGETSEWRPGQHRAVIMINGRKVSEREFEVM